VRAAGVRRIGDAVEFLEVPAPRALRPDEVLLEVQASGVGNWDEFARTGGWDLGARRRSGAVLTEPRSCCGPAPVRERRKRPGVSRPRTAHRGAAVTPSGAPGPVVSGRECLR